MRWYMMLSESKSHYVAQINDCIRPEHHLLNPSSRFIPVSFGVECSWKRAVPAQCLAQMSLGAPTKAAKAAWKEIVCHGCLMLLAHNWAYTIVINLRAVVAVYAVRNENYWNHRAQLIQLFAASAWINPTQRWSKPRILMNSWVPPNNVSPMVSTIKSAVANLQHTSGTARHLQIAAAMPQEVPQFGLHMASSW